MRKICIILSLIILFVLSGCNSEGSSNNGKSSTPEQTIRNHFKARNDANVPELDKTLSENMRVQEWQLDNIDYIKLIDLEELDSAKWIQDHPTMMKDRPSSYSVKIFKVDYEVKYKRLHQSEDPTEGRDFRFFILTQEDPSSPWLIDSISL